MIRQSILFGLIFGILVIGSAFQFPYAQATVTPDTLKFDISNGATPDIIQVSNDVFAVAYVGSSGDGKIATFSVDSNGLIGDKLLNSETVVTFDSGTVTNPKITHISGTTYAVVYAESGKIKMSTIKLESSGKITTILTGTEISSDGSDPDIVNVNNPIYAVAYSGTSNPNAGFIQTVNIASDGSAITKVTGDSPFNFESTAKEIEIIKISHSDDTYAVAYEASGTNGQVETITISDDGTSISSTNMDVATFDTNSPKTPNIVHVTGTTYALAYQTGGTKGFIETVTILDNGQDVTTNVATPLTFESTKALNPVLIQLNTNSPKKFAVVYEGVDSDGFLKTFTISDNGATISSVISADTIEFDSNDGQTPVIFHRTGDIYVIAYKGSGANGFIKTVNFGSTDSTKPTLTSVSIKSNFAKNTSFAKSTDTVTLTFTASEEIQTPTVTINGNSETPTNPNDNTWTATRTIGAGDSEGKVTFSIAFSDINGNAGTTVTTTTDNTSVTVDKTPPTVSSAKYVGKKSFQVTFNEPVVSESGDANTHYTSISADGTPNRSASSSSGNGTKTIKVVFTLGDMILVDGLDAGSFTVASIKDRAGNTIAGDTKSIPAVAASSSLTVSTTADDPIVILGDDMFTTTISGPSPQLNMTQLSSDTLPSVDITVDSTNADLLFTSGTVLSNLPSDELIELSVSSKSADSSVLPTGHTTGTIIELGDPNVDITFDKPVKITLPDQSGNTPFVISGESGSTRLITTCNTAYATAAAALTGGGGELTANAKDASGDCAFDSGDDKIIWSTHFSGFGSSSKSASGGSSSDTIAPSLTTGFADNEYPLTYDGVVYKNYQFDDVHTAQITTGESLEIQTKLFENSGASNVVHFEAYFNQFGNQILNDRTETIVMYDANTGMEIQDPHDLIQSATVTPSASNSKAVFDVSVVFNGEIPQSDVVFRIWDIKRNQIQFILPDALIVEQEPSSGIISEPESSEQISETEESTEIVEPSEPSTETIPSEPLVPKPKPEEPKEITHPGGFATNQIDVLKKWGGFDVESATDIEVLGEFGIKGKTIPQWFKQTTKWFINGDVTREDFVNALNDFKQRGLLDNTNSQKITDTISQPPTVEKLTQSQLSIKIEDKVTQLDADISVNDIQDKVSKIQAVANNKQIQDLLRQSNNEFSSFSNVGKILEERNIDWQKHVHDPSQFMEQLLSNPGSTIAQSIIETDSGSIMPIETIVITNVYGATVIMTDIISDYDQSDDNWWINAKKEGLYITSGSSEEFYAQNIAEISLPVYDASGEFLGVISAKINLADVLR